MDDFNFSLWLLVILGTLGVAVYLAPYLTLGAILGMVGLGTFFVWRVSP